MLVLYANTGYITNMCFVTDSNPPATCEVGRQVVV